MDYKEMKRSMDAQCDRLKVRNEMIKDGYSEYDINGNVTNESVRLWETEFHKRLHALKEGVT